MRVKPYGVHSDSLRTSFCAEVTAAGDWSVILCSDIERLIHLPLRVAAGSEVKDKKDAHALECCRVDKEIPSEEDVNPMNARWHTSTGTCRVAELSGCAERAGARAVARRQTLAG